MTNQPKDLDQGDVIADAQTMMQKEIDDWAEQLDGADLPTVLSIIASHTGDSIHTLIESALGQELIRSTQSNPERAVYAMTQMLDLEDAMNSL
jgi:hypothetical protein